MGGRGVRGGMCMRSSDITSGCQNGTYRDTTIQQLCACTDMMSQLGYNGRDTIFDDRATITSAHACVGVTSLHYRDTMIGIHTIRIQQFCADRKED